MSDGWDQYAPFYDWENARTFGRRDVSFWARLLATQPGRALELGCGTGRLLVPLARRGASVTGLDRSAPMLDRARERARRLSRAKRPPLVRGDVRTLPFRDRTFQTVLAPYGLLQSLTKDADLEATLAEAARVLKRGGRLGIDLVPDLQVWPTYQKALTLRGRLGRTAVTLTESVRQDRRRGLTIFDEIFTTRSAGRNRRHRFQLTFRTIAAHDMLARLAAAGFRVDAVHGDYAGGPWTTGSDTWLILATKK